MWRNTQEAEEAPSAKGVGRVKKCGARVQIPLSPLALPEKRILISGLLFYPK